MTLKFVTSKASIEGEFAKIRPVMSVPASATNSTYCEKLWSPLVTLKPRLAAVNAKLPAAATIVRPL